MKNVESMPDNVWVNPKGGSHYHVKGCPMIDSPDYVVVPFIVVDRRRFSGNCTCVDKLLSRGTKE